MNIFLVGYRGTGKSSVGKSIASALGWLFIDTDSELIAQLGTTIAEYVQAHGWQAFRKKEKTALQCLCSGDMRVIATGGGVAVNEENIISMRQSGVVIWLKALPETIKRRLLVDEQGRSLRPALTSGGLLEEIDEMLQIRNPYYESAMHFSIDTDRLSIEETCNIAVSWLLKNNLL